MNSPLTSILGFSAALAQLIAQFGVFGEKGTMVAHVVSAGLVGALGVAAKDAHAPDSTK